MKYITVNQLKKQSLEEFCEEHQLTLDVDEVYVNGSQSYTASFKNTLVKDERLGADNLYLYKHGTGPTISLSIVDYLLRISDRYIKVGEKEIYVPVLLWSSEDFREAAIWKNHE